MVWDNRIFVECQPSKITWIFRFQMKGRKLMAVSVVTGFAKEIHFLESVNEYGKQFYFEFLLYYRSPAVEIQILLKAYFAWQQCTRYFTATVSKRHSTPWV